MKSRQAFAQLWGCSWHCFDKDLRLFNMIMFWFTFQNIKVCIKTKWTAALLPGKRLGCQAAVDFALIKTWDYLTCWCFDFTFQKHQGLYQNKVNCSLTIRQRLGCQAAVCFDKDLRLFNMIMLWFIFQKQQGFYQNKVNCSLITRYRLACFSYNCMNRRIWLRYFRVGLLQHFWLHCSFNWNSCLFKIPSYWR